MKGGKATIALRRRSGFALSCPGGRLTATLKGSGVSGRATAKVAAGKSTPIAMSVHGPAGKAVRGDVHDRPEDERAPDDGAEIGNGELHELGNTRTLT